MNQSSAYVCLPFRSTDYSDCILCPVHGCDTFRGYSDNSSEVFHGEKIVPGGHPDYTGMGNNCNLHFWSKMNYFVMIILLTVAVRHGLTEPSSATFSVDDEVQVLKVIVCYLLYWRSVFFSARISTIWNPLVGESLSGRVICTNMLGYLPYLPGDCVRHVCTSSYLSSCRTVL